MKKQSENEGANHRANPRPAALSVGTDAAVSGSVSGRDAGGGCVEVAN